MAYLMALDQGTSSSRAIIYREDGQSVGMAQEGFDMSFPASGWVEQDPEVIWQSIVNVGRAALLDAGLDASQIEAIGITNQRETSILWEAQSGACVYPAVVWQDSRTADQCDAMREEEIDGLPLASLIQQRTGLVIDPYFSSTKLAWLLNQDDFKARAHAGELRFGTVDTFLIWRLTGGVVHATDATNASRTQLYDIHQQCWSQELLDYFDVAPELLADVRDSADDFGVADPQWFGAPIPIRGVAGDQQASLIGQGCSKPGQIKSTYGTGCFVMINTGEQALASSQQLLTTVAYRLGGSTTYALEGSIFVAGVALKWLRDQLQLIDDVVETSFAYRASGGDAGGVFVVPAFTGLGAPHWQANARGLITGLTFETTRDQIITAFLQSVALQTVTLLKAMQADGAGIDGLRVDGGMVVNDEFCQFLADVLDISVERPVDVETTALGAAMLAGIGSGLFTDLEGASRAWRLDQHFSPIMSHARRQALLDGFEQAIKQTLSIVK